MTRFNETVWAVAKAIDEMYESAGYTSEDVDEYIDSECSNCCLPEVDPCCCQLDDILKCMKMRGW